VVVLALLAVLVGRGVAQALPGSLTGIDVAIERVEVVGALLTQLAALLLTVLAIRNASLLLFAQPGHPVLRIASASATAVISMMTLLAALLAHNQLAPHWSMLAAAIVAAMLSWAGWKSLRLADQRGVALIAILVAATALVHTGARVIALGAADRASVLGFTLARSLATAGFILEVLCLLASIAWLLVPRNTWSRAAGSLVVAVAPALALAASREENWAVVLRRTLERLSAHPDPIVPDVVRYSVELSSVGLVLLCAFSRARPVNALMILALCLLGRASADIPLGAVFLLNAGLALQLVGVPTAARPRTAP
jgi:hypothetical protein